MSLLTKLAVFLGLAGVLAALLTVLPEHREKLIPTVKSVARKVEAVLPQPQVGPKAQPVETKESEAGGSVQAEQKIFSPNVKVPAIRGLTNYGWVQLPRGTHVDLVAERGENLWVRWDGTTVKVPHGAAATGAIVVR